MKQKRKIGVTRNSVSDYDSQLLNLQNAGDYTNMPVKIKFTDSDGTSRTSEFDIKTINRDTLRDQIYQDIFETKCTFDEDLVGLIEKDFDSNDNRLMYTEPYCGTHYFENWHDNWMTVYNYWYNNELYFDFVQDEDLVNTLCFAYYEQLQYIGFYAETTSSQNHGFLNNNQFWEKRIDLRTAAPGEWAYECFDVKNLFNEMLGDRGDIDSLEIVSVKVWEIKIKQDWTSSEDRYPMIIDSLFVGYADNVATISPPVQSKGIKMNDGRGISSLTTWDQGGGIGAGSYSFDVKRDSTDKNERTSSVCGYRSPDIEVIEINGVPVDQVSDDYITSHGSVGINRDYTADGITVNWQHWHYAPSQISGTFSISNKVFDVSTVTESDIEQFYSERGENVKVNFDGTCKNGFSYEIEWTDDLYEPKEFVVDLDAITTGALESTVEITDRYDKMVQPAGVWIQRLTPNMVRQASSSPHVTVKVGDSQVICFEENECRFEFLANENVVESISLSEANSQSSLAIIVSGDLKNIESVVLESGVQTFDCENLQCVQKFVFSTNFGAGHKFSNALKLLSVTISVVMFLPILVLEKFVSE